MDKSDESFDRHCLEIQTPPSYHRPDDPFQKVVEVWNYLDEAIQELKYQMGKHERLIVLLLDSFPEVKEKYAIDNEKWFRV